MVRGFLSWVWPKHNVNYESWTRKVPQISGCQSLIQCLVFSHLIFLSSHFPSRDPSYPLQAFLPLCHVQSFLIICFGSLLIWGWENNNNNEYFFSPFFSLFGMCVHVQGLCDLEVKNSDKENSFSPHFFFFLFVCVCVCACMCLWFCDLNLEVKELQHVCMCVRMCTCTVVCVCVC